MPTFSEVSSVGCFENGDLRGLSGEMALGGRGGGCYGREPKACGVKEEVKEKKKTLLERSSRKSLGQLIAATLSVIRYIENRRVEIEHQFPWLIKSVPQ